MSAGLMRPTTCPRREDSTRQYAEHSMLDQRHRRLAHVLMWDAYVFEETSGAGRRVLGLRFTSLLGRRFNGRRGKIRRSGELRRHCFIPFRMGQVTRTWALGST